MRIIAGRLGGRNFNSPHAASTHPMSEKVRGAMFNTLGDIEGLTLLDAFAGSGALGYEAVSRGAASAILIEDDRMAQRTIVENIQSLGLQNQVRLVRANNIGWSNRHQNVHFDLVVADPPFDDLQSAYLDKLVRHVKPGGLYVINWPGNRRLDPPRPHGLTLVDQKDYGDTELFFYR